MAILGYRLADEVIQASRSRPSLMDQDHCKQHNHHQQYDDHHCPHCKTDNESDVNGCRLSRNSRHCSKEERMGRKEGGEGTRDGGRGVDGVG